LFVPWAQGDIVGALTTAALALLTWIAALFLQQPEQWYTLWLLGGRSADWRDLFETAVPLMVFFGVLTGSLLESIGHSLFVRDLDRWTRNATFRRLCIASTLFTNQFAAAILNVCLNASFVGTLVTLFLTSTGVVWSNSVETSLLVHFLGTTAATTAPLVNAMDLQAIFYGACFILLLTALPTFVVFPSLPIANDRNILTTQRRSLPYAVFLITLIAFLILIGWIFGFLILSHHTLRPVTWNASTVVFALICVYPFFYRILFTNATSSRLLAYHTMVTSQTTTELTLTYSELAATLHFWSLQSCLHALMAVFTAISILLFVLARVLSISTT
jgi:hypothetical protein